MTALSKWHSAAHCFLQKYAQLTEITHLKTVASDEGKADGSVFLFGVSNKKILSQP